MLVDGQGQFGDSAFPMSYPDVDYGGRLIETATLESPAGVGHILMQLAPAYDPVHGITSYTREWFFEPVAGCGWWIPSAAASRTDSPGCSTPGVATRSP